ncbi:hypothetical protein AB7180_21185, partial [Providencia rettgeri]
DYHQTNQKTNTGKTLKPWPILVDHYSTKFSTEGSNVQSSLSTNTIHFVGWTTFVIKSRLLENPACNFHCTRLKHLIPSNL